MNIIHDKKKHTVSVQIEGHTACAEYALDARRIDILHVEVAKPLRGGEVASDLVQFLCDFARTEKLQITATCPYAKIWLKRHPEYATD